MHPASGSPPPAPDPARHPDGYGPIGDGRKPIGDGRKPIDDGYGSIDDGDGSIGDGHGAGRLCPSYISSA
uniref:Uncharacterized protein n=1 Tax=Candidatus Kentrum sp. TUN TaxID=2126343 RepID=A0A451AFP0_9GAMM|nr:MAG: hypothetical protein BECKTUN1418F_GA0071002_15631 [Candidatus Kentron sp. TUN]VFK73082.1 MAG: hypothetical protein BECKTUN1418E_GA0071001_15741 [Candidatus Kentron sp. TUN]